MRLKYEPHLVEVTGLHLAQRLGIESLTDARRPLPVGGHDRHLASDLFPPSAGSQRRSASRAGTQVGGIRRTAVGTNDDLGHRHTRECTQAWNGELGRLPALP